MKNHGQATVALLALLATGGLGVGARFWAVDHVQRWTGRSDLGFVTCTHCHLQRLENMPWAKPRPRHASPAGLAVSADSQKVYIALDDLDEIVEANISSRAVTRRLSLPGRPFGLAVDADGSQLFVTCRDSDEVVVSISGTLSPWIGCPSGKRRWRWRSVERKPAIGWWSQIPSRITSPSSRSRPCGRLPARKPAANLTPWQWPRTVRSRSSPIA